MEASERTERRRFSLNSQQGRRLFVLPKVLIDLDEIRQGWGVSDYRVYKLVNKGSLTTVSRPGHQRYYLLDEINREFGPRVNPPPTDVNPGKRSGFEYEPLAA